MNNHHSNNSIKGRGTGVQPPGRFAIRTVELDNDDVARTNPDSVFLDETAKTILSRNQSPDVPFRVSLNPFRGCEQGCIYCFARPSHAYLDLSPGLDFETRISVKHNAAQLFEEALRRPNYHCETIALGINTDAYQPIEKQRQITRQILNIALRYRQPISIVTKSGLILRDKDILEEMAKLNLIHVAVSVTTLDNQLKRIMEPRAAAPQMRLKVIAELSHLKVPVSVLIAPVIPLINDREMEAILHAVSSAGAQSAAYILLRLPYELTTLFVDWLYQHFPDRAGHVVKRIEDMHGGKLYNSRFGERMKGSGIFAELINQRFHVAQRKAGLDNREVPKLDCSAFRVPPRAGDQLSLL